ncbi:MAG: MATE family efflux transporter, partial [Eubacteriales bacterium]
QALMSVMTYGINIVLVKVDEALVTAYGLYYKIQQFIIFAAFGLRDAITPVVSYAHGMKSKKRIADGTKYGIIYTLAIMLAGTLVIEIFASNIAGMFSLSGKTEELFVGAMRIISISFVFAGFNIASQGVFQALDSGAESLIISICRQFLFVIPTAWGFSKLIVPSLENSFLVWLAFPLAEIVSSLIAGIFLIRKRQMISNEFA